MLTKTRVLKTLSNVSSNLSSVSFSGAGFLGSYHTGVAACLMKHNLVLKPMERIDDKNSSKKSIPILTGVSAGSLVSAAISAGVTPDDAMNLIYEIAKRTKEYGGVMDVMKPGFSLIDKLEDVFISTLQRALGGGTSHGDYDNELLMSRTQNGSLLRIGLADKRKLSLTAKKQSDAYVYVDKYRNLDDVVAACMLSSYVPLMTGPLLGISDPFENGAIKRAAKQILVMEKMGFLKDGITGLPVVSKREDEKVFQTDETDESVSELNYWDGGFADMFPTLNGDTLIVSPFSGKFTNPHISPQSSDNPRPDIDRLKWIFDKMYIEHCDKVSIGVSIENLKSLYRVVLSSDESVLEERFQNGYDDASKYLKKII